MLVRLGEDPTREGLPQTPERVRKAMQFLTKGYNEDPEALLKGALFSVNYDEMVIVKDIEMFSLCEHHMLPFFGKVHVAYIPTASDRAEQDSAPDRTVLPPPADSGAPHHPDRRNHPEVIEPQGVGVVIEARHLCMMMRGVEKQHSAAVTSSMLGCFRKEEETRSEFLSLIRQRPNGMGLATLVGTAASAVGGAKATAAIGIAGAHASPLLQDVRISSTEVWEDCFERFF